MNSDTIDSGSAVHPLLRRLIDDKGYPSLQPETLADFLAQPGEALLFFAENPLRYNETLDVAVILPELVAASATALRAGVLLPEAARALAQRYAIRHWPALVFVCGDEVLGTIEGVRDGSEYRQTVIRFADSRAGRPAGADIPLTRMASAAQGDRR
jgi:hydrogenase-1 operon protein HyaE